MVVWRIQEWRAAVHWWDIFYLFYSLFWIKLDLFMGVDFFSGCS